MKLFEHINYEGASLELTNDTPDLRTHGAQWNDQASSVRVPAGSTVTLFEHINYGGRSLVLTSDTPDLRVFDWNDGASSVKVSAGPIDEVPPGAVRLKRGGRYVECNAGGTITSVSTPTDDGVVALTKHDGNHFDARFVKANKQLSIQNDGSLQSRPAGTFAAFEMEQVFATTQPEERNLLYRNDGTRLFGEPLLIEDIA